MSKISRLVLASAVLVFASSAYSGESVVYNGSFIDASLFADLATTAQEGERIVNDFPLQFLQCFDPQISAGQCLYECQSRDVYEPSQVIIGEAPCEDAVQVCLGLPDGQAVCQGFDIRDTIEEKVDAFMECIDSAKDLIKCINEHRDS